jgi:hypothetical protein
MSTYTPAYEYPRANQTDLSEDDRQSLDINEREPVANFILEAIEKVIWDGEGQVNRADVSTIGLIIENMLDEGFGDHPDGLSYREFVMNYVRKRFPSAWCKHKRTIEALVALGLIDIRRSA